MEGAAPANGEANESKDTEEALANQQQDEELAAANGGALLQGSSNEGRRSCGSANEDTEPQEAANDSEEPQPASENTGHKAPTNEDSGHKSSTNEDAAPRASTNRDTAPIAAANENNARQAPPNQDTPPQDRTYDLAPLPDAANQAADPWDWSLEEAWLRAPEEEGPDACWAEPEGWGVEPEEEEEEEVEEGPEQWRPSPDGAWAKLIVRPGRGLARPGPGSWCRVRLTIPCSGRSMAAASGSGHGLSDPSSGHGLSDPSSGHGLSDPSSGHGLSDPSSRQALSDPSSGQGLSDPSSGHSPSPASGCGRWVTVQLGTAEGRWSCLVDAALETMTAGELSRLRPAGADAALTVRLGHFTPAPPFWDAPAASRWRSVTSGHARAAALLSQGLLAAAGRAYSRSLRAAVAAAGPPPLPPDAAAVKAELHAGLALVQLRLGLPAAAAGNAGKALALCPAHLEARYRRGVAQAAMRDLEAATADLVAVLRVQPGHAGARRELRRVRGAARERDARLARRLGRLFA